MNEHQLNLFFSIMDNNFDYFAGKLKDNFQDMHFDEIIKFDSDQDPSINNYADYSFGYCCLAMASQVGNVKMIEQLLDSGCKFNNEMQSNISFTKQVRFATHNDNFLHPAYVAYKNKHPEVLQFFLEKQIKFIDKIQGNYVHLLVMQDDSNEDKNSIKDKNIVTDDAIKQLNCFRDNILHIAVLFGRKSVVEYILEEARNGKTLFSDMVNALNHEGNTPLHLACLLNNNDILKVFLEYSQKINLDFNVVNNDRKLPISIATNNENKDAVVLLDDYYDISNLLYTSNQQKTSPLKVMARNNTGSQSNMNIGLEENTPNSNLSTHVSQYAKPRQSFFNQDSRRDNSNKKSGINESRTMPKIPRYCAKS